MRDAIRGIILGMIFLSLLGTMPFLLISCMGCIQRPIKDLSSASEYNFESFAGTVWKTRVKVAVAELGSPGRRQTYLLEPHAFDPTHPEYTPPHDMKIIQVLPVGTRLQIEQLLMKENLEWR